MSLLSHFPKKTHRPKQKRAGIPLLTRRQLLGRFFKRLWEYVTSVATASLLGLNWFTLLFVAFAFITRMDILNNITVIPYAAWCLFGMLFSIQCWFILRRRAYLLSMAVWGIMLIFFADETIGVMRKMFPPRTKIPPLYTAENKTPLGVAPLTPPAPLAVNIPPSVPPSPPSAKPPTKELKKPIPLRIVSFNAMAITDTYETDLIIRLKPDIIFFQEINVMRYTKQNEMIQKLYGTNGFANYFGPVGIYSRGKIDAQFIQLRSINGHAIRVEVQPGKFICLLNVHMIGAYKSYTFWNPEVIKEQFSNRYQRRVLLQQLLAVFLPHTNNEPVMIGGDFNAPAGDAIFRELKKIGFQDSYRTAGRGWGNTYANTMPVLRIDQMWYRGNIRAVANRVLPCRSSDHRILVCDFLLEPDN